LEAVAHRRGMDRAFEVGSVLVGVAGETERVGRRGDQLHARDVFRHPHFVATGTPHGNGGVHRFALGFVLVALNALGRVCVLVERYRMCGSAAEAGTQNQGHSHIEPDYSHTLPPPEKTTCARRLPRTGKPAGTWPG